MRSLARAAGLVFLLSCANREVTPSNDAGAVDGGVVDACVDLGSGLPSDVFCAGLYAGHDPSQHVAEALAYTPGVTLWSDGAEKQRYLYLPPGTTIDTSDMDAWKFPIGTRAWKEFRLDGALVETRIFWKRNASTWEAGTYIWDAAGKTASLDTGRKGTLLPSGYEIPTARDCGKCHHGGSDHLLGIEAVALALPTTQGVTLASLVARGALSHPPARTSTALPEDVTGKAGAALGYLHANCGMPCHSGRGLGDETKLHMRLRADELFGGDAGTVSAATTDTYRATVGQDPTTASVVSEFPGDHRITPGAHDRSVVWLVAHRRGNYQMPPLVSHRVDDVGTETLATWIDAMHP
jgi:hypothetical protein